MASVLRGDPSAQKPVLRMKPREPTPESSVPRTEGYESSWVLVRSRLAAGTAPGCVHVAGGACRRPRACT